MRYRKWRNHAAPKETSTPMTRVAAMSETIYEMDRMCELFVDVVKRRLTINAGEMYVSAANSKEDGADL